MIVGIGTDMVDIRRIEAVYARFGERFSNRVLNPQEVLAFQVKNFSVNFLAKRYAVKEAAAKALRVGIGARANLHNISIVNDAAGAPSLQFTGVAHSTAVALGVECSHVSITDEPPYALAFVVLSR
ncbi:MAG: holo-ACP synthase [Spongiibacteraceae bacterium]